MSKIMAVRIDEQLIQLIPHKAELYGPLFEIDSISLLLGTNGSGKTRMLHSLANAVVSSQDDSFQFYFQGTPNGNYEPTAPYNNELCAIYYTALPYKRKLTKRKGVIDASPNTRKSTDINSLQKYGVISEALGVNTELVAVLRYSKKVFRTILIPAIRSHGRVNSDKLKELTYKYEDLSRNSQDNDYLIIDQKREVSLNNIEVVLESLIRKRCGRYSTLLHLASLEYIHGKLGGGVSRSVALDFLSHLGIIDDDSNFSALDELKRVVYLSDNFISECCESINYEADDHSIKFRINNINFSNMINNLDTSIQIEWSNQSSGIQALVEQFSLIEKSIKQAVDKNYKSILLLIDEGDAYLHLDWQRKYISMLNKFLGGVKSSCDLNNLQLIIATHSPLLAADIPGDFVTSLDSNKFSNTFAAPLDEVIATAFSSNSIGEFAATNINKIYKRALNGNATKYDLNLIDSIGDVAVKKALKRSLGNGN